MERWDVSNGPALVSRNSPASAVGSVHDEPYLYRWVSSPMGSCVPHKLGPAFPNGSRIPGHVVLAHVDWNLTHSAGLLVG